MGKKPLVILEQLKEVEKAYPTPFYIYDERGIRENAARLKRAFSWNKGHKEYFAVKVTSSPFLLNVLKDVGYNADCSSMMELMMSRACDFSGPDIMFSSNDTPPGEFTCTERLGAVINLDDITRIQCLEEILGHIPKTISCCFNPDGLFKISNGIMNNSGDSECGMTTEQIGQVFKTLKEKGAKYSGIYAFLASSTMANEYYPMLTKILFEPTAKLKEETGVHIASINLSGNIGIPYHPDQEPNDVLIIGNGVRRVYEEILVPTGVEDVALYTELGRFIIGPCGALVTKAIHEKHTYKEYVDVDACAVDPMRPVVYGVYHHITIMRRKDEPCTRMYDVAGSLCKNNGKFAVGHMPSEIRKGDLLFIHDVGTHGFVVGHNYNGKLKSAELLLEEDGTVEMIHRAETSENYFATFDFCDILRDIE